MYDFDNLTVEIHVTSPEDLVLNCPECGKVSPDNAHRPWKWRYTLICTFPTQVEARLSWLHVRAWEQGGIRA